MATISPRPVPTGAHAPDPPEPTRPPEAARREPAVPAGANTLGRGAH